MALRLCVLTLASYNVLLHAHQAATTKQHSRKRIPSRVRLCLGQLATRRPSEAQIEGANNNNKGANVLLAREALLERPGGWRNMNRNLIRHLEKSKITQKH